MRNAFLLAKPGDRRDPSTSTSFACKGGTYARIRCIHSAGVIFFMSFCGCFRGRSQSQSGRSAGCGCSGGAGVAAARERRQSPRRRRAHRPKALRHFATAGAEHYQVQVLAPGFAAETVDVSSQAEITVNLQLATASETVVVSATRTPVPGEAAGADVDVSERGATDDDAADGGERCACDFFPARSSILRGSAAD